MTIIKLEIIEMKRLAEKKRKASNNAFDVEGTS